MLDKHYDIVVAGAGCSGVAAAIGAAKTGAKVLLVERYGFLGGAATASQVLAFCGFYPQKYSVKPSPVVAGVGREVLDQLALLGLDVEPYYSSTGNWPIRINPEATKIALDRLVKAHKIALSLHSSVCKVHLDASNSLIKSVEIQDPSGIKTISANAFVDASGDAELAFLAGVTRCSLYQSDHVNQPAAMPFRISGVSHSANIDRAARADIFSKFKKGFGRASIKTDGGFLTALPFMDDFWLLSMEVNTNGLDGDDLAEAEQDARELAWEMISFLRCLPGWENANLSSTGPKLGIRESRHPATMNPLREHILEQCIITDDSIALGGWPMEVHQGLGQTSYKPIGGAGYFGIPLSSLLSLDFKNLVFAGRCIGADQASYGSVRVMGTAFATGHAAGVAAALNEYHVETIRTALYGQGALI